MGKAWPSSSSLPNSATPATQPGPGRKRKDHGFKVSTDGRLIIQEEEDAAATKVEEEEGTKGRQLLLAWAMLYLVGHSFTHLFLHSFTQ